jgi:hypothetical protein
MLYKYVPYVHLTKAKGSLIIRENSIFSLKRMLNKDYDSKGSVAKQSLVVSLKEVGAKTN